MEELPRDSSHLDSKLMTTTVDSALQVQNLSQRNTGNNRKPCISTIPFNVHFPLYVVQQGFHTFKRMSV